MKHGISLFCLISLLFAGSLAVAADVVTVVDENQKPVANATVLFGYDSNDPFPNNILTTNANGIATVPAAWKAALPVTVQASGYVSATIPIAAPGSMTVQINHQESPTEIQLSGLTTGFGDISDDGKVQFGLVIPAVTHDQLLSFDMSAVISPQTDTITAVGQSFDLPSNLTLPNQTETYIVPINFNKPNYRAYVRSNGPYLMTATHGNFPLARVVNDARAGKSIFDMINYLNFTEGATQAVTVNGDTVSDMPVNQVQFNSSVSVKAPTFAANQVMVSLALNEQNGLLLPTDLKRLTTGQSLNLKSTGSAPSVLSLLMINANPTMMGVMESAMRMLSPLGLLSPPAAPPTPKSAQQSFLQLSYALLPATGGSAPQFLTLIDPPTLDTAGNVLKMTPPQVPAGLSAVATYMVMTEILAFPGGIVQSEQRTRLWEIYSSAWLSQIELPKINFARNPNRTYRWEVMYLAQPTSITGGTARVNGVDLQSVTHVTRNALAL